VRGGKKAVKKRKNLEKKFKDKNNTIMKKIIFTTLIVFTMGWAGKIQAQDCNAIVRPLIILRNIDTNYYPAEKLAQYCIFSQCAFFITNQVPSDAIVNEITSLSNSVTGERVPQDFVADLNTISYWGYNFFEFRPRGYQQPIYFRMGSGSSVQYLGVRSYDEAMARSTEPERFKD